MGPAFSAYTRRKTGAAVSLLHPVLCAVFGGGDVVQAAEGFQEAAVIREATLGAGVQDGNALFQRLAAVLHPQIGQVIVDALHGALLECAGKVLPAGVKFLCQLRGGQGRVLIMGLQVSHSARDQYTGAAGGSGLSAAGGLRDEQQHLSDLRLKNDIPDGVR